MKLLGTIAAFCCLLGFAGCDSARDRVGFYIVRNLSTDHLESVSPQTVIIDDSPIFTADEISEIFRGSGTIRLKPRAFARFRKAEESERPNTAFAVCLDRQARYLGRMTKRMSSDLDRSEGASETVVAYVAGGESPNSIRLNAERYEPNDKRLEPVISGIYDLLENPPPKSRK